MNFELDKFSLTDLVQSVTTAIAAIFAFVYALQNNKNLQELKRQNDLASTPIPRVDIVLEPPKDNDLYAQCDIDDSAAKCKLEELQSEWIEHLRVIGIDSSSFAEKRVWLALRNKGASAIERTRLRLKIEVEHHEAAKKDYRSNGISKQFEFEIDRELDQGAQPILVNVLQIQCFPVCKISATILEFTDVKGETHVLKDPRPIKREFLAPSVIPTSLVQGQPLEYQETDADLEDFLIASE